MPRPPAIGASLRRLPHKRQRRPAQRPPASADRSGSGLYLDWLCSRAERPHLLAHGAHGLLGRRQSGLEPDALALGLHVLRAGAALDRRHAAARAPARRRCSPGWRPARPQAAPRRWPGFLLVSASRRGAAINRGLARRRPAARLRRQPRHLHRHLRPAGAVDAQLTLGADVVASAPPGVTAAHNLQQQIAAVPGVAGDDRARPLVRLRRPRPAGHLRHRPLDSAKRTSCATPTSSAERAQQILDRLRSTPDGILVSKETISDYQLKLGDLLKLRVLDRRRAVPGRALPRRRHRAQEFPSAPQDSFMVANLVYLERPRTTPARTWSSPRRTATRRRWRAPDRAPPPPTAPASRTSAQQIAATVSSITTVDLAGISRIEEVFVVLLAAAAMGLFVTRRPRRTPPGVRDDGRARRLAARDRRLPLE